MVSGISHYRYSLTKPVIVCNIKLLAGRVDGANCVFFIGVLLFLLDTRPSQYKVTVYNCLQYWSVRNLCIWNNESEPIKLKLIVKSDQWTRSADYYWISVFWDTNKAVTISLDLPVFCVEWSKPVQSGEVRVTPSASGRRGGWMLLVLWHEDRGSWRSVTWSCQAD